MPNADYVMDDSAKHVAKFAGSEFVDATALVDGRFGGGPALGLVVSEAIFRNGFPFGVDGVLKDEALGGHLGFR